MTRCCGKTSYATREAAEAALHGISFTATGRHPTRAYRCDAGWWHLTSMRPARWTRPSAPHAPHEPQGAR